MQVQSGRHLWAPHVIHTQAWGSRGPSPTSLPACPRLACVRSLPPGAEVAHLAEQMVQVSHTSRLGSLCLLLLPKPVRSASGLQEREPSWLRERLQAQPQTSRPGPTDPGSRELSVQPAMSSQTRGRLFFFNFSITYIFGENILVISQTLVKCSKKKKKKPSDSPTLPEPHPPQTSL